MQLNRTSQLRCNRTTIWCEGELAGRVRTERAPSAHSGHVFATPARVAISRPTRPQSQNKRHDGVPRPFGELTTVRAALSHLGESFSDQVREASDQLAPPNAPIPGDREVREAFWVLLPPDLQRQFFLRVAGDRRAWPRLKTLIGNPPYSFLRAEDEGVLRAGGICKRRARNQRMAAIVGISGLLSSNY